MAELEIRRYMLLCQVETVVGGYRYLSGMPTMVCEQDLDCLHGKVIDQRTSKPISEVSITNFLFVVNRSNLALVHNKLS